jgi:MFS transporter, DHA1 family, tetracycline resistance protein
MKNWRVAGRTGLLCRRQRLRIPVEVSKTLPPSRSGAGLLLKSSRSPRLLIFLTIFIDLLGFGIIIPVLPYISSEYAQGPNTGLLVGLMMSSFSLLQMIFSPIWGRLSDRIGRRPIILLGLAGSAIAYTWFALARNYEMLLLSRVFAGICGANIAAAQAYIADVTPAEGRTKAMGLVGMAFGLGFAIGPALGAGAMFYGGNAWPDIAPQTFPGVVAGIICGLNFLWAAAALPESLPKEKRGRVAHVQRFATIGQIRDTLASPILGPLVVLFFIVTFAFSNLEMAFVLYAKAEPPVGLGLSIRGVYGVFIYIGLTLAFMYGYVVRKVSGRVLDTRLVIVGIASQAIGLALLPTVPAMWMLLLAMGILSFGQGFSNPPLLSLISRATPADRQGAIMGVTQSAGSLARILGPAFAGLVIDFTDLRWPFWAAAVIMAVAVVLAQASHARIARTPGALSQDEPAAAPMH